MSRVKGCVISRVMNDGDQADREALQTLLNSDASHIGVARTLTDAGVPISEHAIRRHRKADCSCGWL